MTCNVSKYKDEPQKGRKYLQITYLAKDLDAEYTLKTLKSQQ